MADGVPTISRFRGVIIKAHHRDHEPPHFHAIYAGLGALVGVDPVEVLESELPARVEAMVIEWAEAHRQELLENWSNAVRMDLLTPIPPTPFG